MKLQPKIFTALLAIALLTLTIYQLTSWLSFVGIAILIFLVVAISYFLSKAIAEPWHNFSHTINQLLAEVEKDNNGDFNTNLLTGIVRKNHEPDALSQLIRSSVNKQEIALTELAKISQIKDRMASELDIGREIQMNLLTLTLPNFPKRQDLDLYAVLQPARELGGDFYDFYFFHGNMSYLFEDHRFFFCVGDVSGKGVPAALFLSVTKSLINSQSSQESSPGNILTHVNQAISLNNPSCMFVTLFCGVLNLINGELTYTNAGHNPPYVKRQDGQLEKLMDKHGPALGIIEDIEYRQSQTNLNSGDILVVYTDGVTEAMDQEQNLFSDQRLFDLLNQQILNSPKEVVDVIMQDVSTFQGEAEQADDITLLSLQFLGHPVTDHEELLSLSLKKDIISRFKDA